jgi:putative two-component system response regulator
VGAESVNRKTVLVVDDHRAVRALCRASLEEAGFRVLEAENGTAALASVQTERPDAILLDIMMPGISGWEVTAALLADRSTDQIPIIFISGRTEPSDRIRAYELGAQAYVMKPFDPEVLAETVVTVLGEIEHGDREAALAETLASLRKEQVSAGKPRAS